MPKCSQCNKTFEIIDADRVFYRKMEVPDPKSCPDCRLQQKLAWRNELNFYQKVIQKSGITPDFLFIII